jgi:hypothetical protein
MYRYRDYQGVTFSFSQSQSLVLTHVRVRSDSMQKIHAICTVIFIILMALCIPCPVYAEETGGTVTDTDEETTPASLSQTTGLLYNGTVDPESSLSITAESGLSYTIPGNTPVGVLSSLEKAGAVENIAIGDELMKKKGTLLLYGIGNLSSGDGNGWFVKVNGKRLEDVVLAETEGLSRYTLNEGDVVLYTLGDPNGMVSESKAYLTVTVGKIREAEPEPERESSANETTSAPDEISTPESSATPQDQMTEEAEQISADTEEKPVQEKRSDGDQEVLYSGSLSLPSGTITIETTGGEYDIDAATPLGILHALLKDGKISDLSVSDKAMKKGNILILEGINDYHFSGDKTWFVLVNDALLKDYLYDEEGLNIYKIKTGDKIGYYFGEPSQPADAAEARLEVTIE